MQLFEHLKKVSCVLSIGFFDGMHLGHQSVLQRLKERAKEHGAQPALLSFRNHPRSVLKPDFRLEFITPLTQRLRLIEDIGVETLFLLPFTTEFSQQSPEDFFDLLTEKLDLKALVLGHDTHIGNMRSGNRSVVESYAKQKRIPVEYLPPLRVGEDIVSSSKVKDAIRAGDFSLLQKLLGRPYTLSLPVQKGLGIGKTIGFPTANLPVDRLALPPRGVYATRVNRTLPAIANLGVAPTVRSDPTPQLEVHILEKCPENLGETVQVEFVQYLRAEEKFPDLAALQKQISCDVKNAKKALSSLK